jgi:hypothetical protein
MEFWVGDGSIWLRVKAWALELGLLVGESSILLRAKLSRAWDGVLVG